VLPNVPGSPLICQGSFGEIPNLNRPRSGKHWQSPPSTTSLSARRAPNLLRCQSLPAPIPLADRTPALGQNARALCDEVLASWRHRLRAARAVSADALLQHQSTGAIFSGTRSIYLDFAPHSDRRLWLASMRTHLALAPWSRGRNRQLLDVKHAR
jgi:hypothetical protein